MSDLAESIKKRFSEYPPLLLASDESAIKLELKPYLQPFEVQPSIMTVAAAALLFRTVRRNRDCCGVHLRTPE